jgi:transcriptional regulator with XRE-family HTH domain
MGKSSEALIKRLQAEIATGNLRKADICRNAGFSSSQLEAYLQGRSVPGLDAADRIADSIGQPLSEILASAPVATKGPSLPKEILQHVDSIAERTAKQMTERLISIDLSPLARNVAVSLTTLDESELADVADFIETIIRNRSSESPSKSKKLR